MEGNVRSASNKSLVPACLKENHCREVVIDAQVPIEWALPLYGYIMPIIVTITLATNSFIVVVLSRRHLRTPTNSVLLAMAVTELLTGLSCMPWLLYYYSFEGYKTDRETGLPAFWCTMFPYMASILPSIFHTTAIWLTVYLAVQRYIYICLPKMVQNQCTMKRSKQKSSFENFVAPPQPVDPYFEKIPRFLLMPHSFFRFSFKWLVVCCLVGVQILMVIITICIASIWIYAPELFATYNQSYKMFNVQSNGLFNNFYSFRNYLLPIMRHYKHIRTRMACMRIRTVLIDFVGNNIYYYTIYGLHTLLSHTLPCILLVCFTWNLIAAIRVADQRYALLVANRIQPTRKYNASNILDAKNSLDFSMDTNNYDVSCNGSLKGNFVTNFAKRRTSAMESKRVQSLKQNTRMLIAVILLFLVTEIPAALIFSLHVSTVALRITYVQRHYTVLNKLLIVRNVLIIVTYPLRFAVYCGMSQQFRDCVRQMLGRRVFSSRGVARATTTSHTNAREYSQSEPMTTKRTSRNIGGQYSISTSTIHNNNSIGFEGNNMNEIRRQVFAMHRSSSTDSVLGTAIDKKYCTPVEMSTDKSNYDDCDATGHKFAVRAANSVGCGASQKITIQIDDSGCGIDSDEASNEEDGRNDETI